MAIWSLPFRFGDPTFTMIHSVETKAETVANVKLGDVKCTADSSFGWEMVIQIYDIKEIFVNCQKYKKLLQYIKYFME